MYLDYIPHSAPGLVASASVLLVLLSTPSSASQSFRQTDIVPNPGAPPPVAFSDLGHDIALDGDTLFATSPQSSPVGNRVGVVSRYRRAGIRWIQADVLSLPAPMDVDEFGTSIDMVSDLAVVTAPGRRIQQTHDAGAAFVVDRVVDDWVLDPIELHSPSPSDNDNFGSSVATDGEWIAVGADGDDGIAPDAGRVHLFHNAQGSGWIHAGEIVSSVPLQDARFGRSLSMDQGRLAVGSHLNGAGRAEIFVLDPATGTWTLEASLSPVQGIGLDQFGFSLSLDGDRLAVGAPVGGRGYIEVFNFAFGAWLFEAHLDSPYPATRVLGYDVALEGDLLVAGARTDFLTGVGGGGAYAFLSGTNGMWALDRVFAPAEGREQWTTGQSVAVDGTQLAIGCRSADLWPTSNGAVAFFERHDEDITAMGLGDGSLTPCPCGNDSNGLRRQGCINSTDGGAELVGLGGTSLSSADLRFDMRSGVPFNAALLFYGFAGSSMPPLLGDGILAIDGPLVRMTIAVPDSIGHANWPTSEVLHPAWAPGQTVYFQGWYRDPFGPCGAGFNSTNGVSVTFQP